MFPCQTKSQLLWEYFILSWVFTLICSFVRLNICPFVHFIHLYICLSLKLSIFLFAHSVFSVFVHLCKCLLDCFFFLLFVPLSVTFYLTKFKFKIFSTHQTATGWPHQTWPKVYPKAQRGKSRMKLLYKLCVQVRVCVRASVCVYV